jgi:exodeoxyribonuclease V gamma subunit
VEEVVARASGVARGASDPSSVDVRVVLPGDRLLTGTVPGVLGDLLRSVTYSRVSARHRLVAWVRFLALTASHPQRPFEAVTVGRVAAGGDRHAATTVARIPRLDPETARAHLATLVELYDHGMREPLPLACMTSAAYATAVHHGRDPAKAAAKAWTTEWNFPREDADLEHQLVFGGTLTYPELCTRDGFSDHAQQLWAGLLGAEEIVDR